METKNIKVEEEVWWQLNKIKVEKKFKKISDVVKFLLSKSHEPNPKEIGLVFDERQRKP